MSAPDGPFGRLAEMRRAMESGLALLDGARPDDVAVPDALQRIAGAIAVTGDLEAMGLGLGEGERERFDLEVEELLRLNAVLTAAVRQDRDALLQRLKATRESRRDLARQSPAGSEGAGGRCDVSG